MDSDVLPADLRGKVETMKTHSAQIRVEATHLDRGDHANWLAQLAIAEQVLDSFREQLGIGLEELQVRGFFLVMRKVNDVFYRKQLRLGDVLEARLTMWISRPISLGFRCLFSKDGEVATEMNWEMPLVCAQRGRPCKIPSWMVEIIGTEKPELLHL